MGCTHRYFLFVCTGETYFASVCFSCVSLPWQPHRGFSVSSHSVGSIEADDTREKRLSLLSLYISKTQTCRERQVAGRQRGERESGGGEGRAREEWEGGLWIQEEWRRRSGRTRSILVAIEFSRRPGKTRRHHVVMVGSVRPPPRYQSIRRTITNTDRTEENPVDPPPDAADSDLLPHSLHGQFTWPGDQA